jgi:hypothetical protein
MARRLKTFDKLKIGITVTANPLNDSHLSYKVETYDSFGSTVEEYSYNPSGQESISGMVTFMDHKNQKFHILTPEGLIKIVSWMDFAVYMWPKIKAFIQMIIQGIKQLRKK